MEKIAKRSIRITIYILLGICFTFSIQSYAANTPCSGKKGGISHCRGTTFVCNDGSVSASRKNCQGYYGGSSHIDSDTTSSTDMAPATSGDCSCRSGKYCIGPRGGHYCYTDKGNKNYLKR